MKYKFVDPPPMEHQARGVKALIDSDGVHGLLMDPGTGKTRVVLDYLGMLYLAKGHLDVLIAAPLDALDTWPDQARQWLPKEIQDNLVVYTLDEGSILDKAARISRLADRRNPDKLRVILINHDAFKYKHKANGLKTVTVQDRMIEAVIAWRPDIAVYDESHRALKTHDSNTSRAWKRIGRSIEKRIIMTGTPSPKTPLDVFGQWQFLNPKRFGTKWGMFRYTYANYGGYLGREIMSYKNLTRLQHEIAKDAIVVAKEDALDLPPLTELEVPVRLDAKEREAYLSMANEYLVELQDNAMSLATTTLTRVLRLRQITGGSVGYLGEDGKRITSDIGDSKLRVCISKTESLVEQGEKVVIFAHFIRDVHRISEGIDKALNGTRKKDRIPVYSVTGAAKKKDRARWRQDFKNHDGAAVFVAQMRTMSLAINEFVVASNVIFYSMSERRDDYDQAKDRLHRQGQTRPVTAYHLVVPHSIDKAVLDSHREKKRLEHIITGRAQEILTLGESK